MRRRSYSLIIAGMVLLLALVVAAPALADLPGWHAVQLTFGAYTDVSAGWPQVSGDRVVWLSSDGRNDQVWTWKAGDSVGTQLTSDDTTHTNPRVSGDRVVWLASDGSHLQLVTQKVGEVNQTVLTSDAMDHEDFAISGDRIVWIASDGAYKQVYSWTPGQGTVSLTSDAFNHLGVGVSGDRVVWVGEVSQTEARIMTWTPSSGAVDLAAGLVGLPAVSGDRVAWIAAVGSQVHVFTWKAGVGTKTVTSLSGPVPIPQLFVSGDRLAWESSDGSHFQAFTWRSGDKSPKQLTTDAIDHEVLGISGDRIIWGAFDQKTSVSQAFTWRAGCGTTQLTPAGVLGTPTGVSGDRVVWAAEDGGVLQVFTALATQTGLSKPTVSPSKPASGNTAKFATHLAPGAASVGGATALALYHRETKTVRVKRHGTWHKVRIHYWRLRMTLRMKPSSTGASKLAGKARLKYKGSWEMKASYSGWQGYDPAISPMRKLTVK